MHNPNTVMRPIYIGSHQIERVTTYKLLGVIISDDLKWNSHLDYVITKASKRLYTLRILKRAGVPPHNIIGVYKCTIRSILEYAVQAWQDIPEYLSSSTDSVVVSVEVILDEMHQKDLALRCTFVPWAHPEQTFSEQTFSEQTFSEQTFSDTYVHPH